MAPSLPEMLTAARLATAVRLPPPLVLVVAVMCVLAMTACRRGDDRRQGDGAASTDGREGEGAHAVGDEDHAARADSGAVSVNGAAGAKGLDSTALAPLLARADAPGKLADGDRTELEQAMQEALAPALANGCEGCSLTLSYVDEDGGGDRLEGALRSVDGEVRAWIELYRRARLDPGVATSWARATLAGHPSSALSGQHVFVWPGRFEVRAFARAPGLREPGKLEALVSDLPLDALAKL